MPARLRKHGSQFGVAQCAGYHDQATGDPGEQHESGMGDRAGHEGGRDEDGRAHDGSAVIVVTSHNPSALLRPRGLPVPTRRLELRRNCDVSIPYCLRMRNNS